jgi:anaerobic magnesium-protoporphyrin IX monomethyl ester cyclase
LRTSGSQQVAEQRARAQLHHRLDALYPQQHPDPEVRYAMRWYTRMGRRVWPSEILGFFTGKRLRKGPPLAEFWGPSLAEHENALAKPARRTTKRPAIELVTVG